MSARHALRSLAYYGLLALLALPFMLPLLWMISTAFKPVGQVYVAPPVWIPSSPTLDNLIKAWGALDWPRFAANSLWITAHTMLGTLVSSSLAGFAFATLPSRTKGPLFALLLATVMVPSSVTLIPAFVLFSHLGWVNTYLPLIVPAFLGNAFFIFIFRQFFRSLPTEIFEAAELDGCNPLQAYWHVAIPLSRPVLATVAVFAFVGAWNDFMAPLIYLSTTSKYTLALGLSLFQGMYYTQLHYLMPMSLVVLLPVLILFMLAQRHFVRGIVTTGK